MNTASPRLASAFLYVAVVGAPLLAGSTTPTAVSFWCIVLAVGLAVADPQSLRSVQRWWLWLPALLIVAYAAVFLAQTLPPKLTGLPPNPIWERASKALGSPLDSSVAVVRGQTWLALGGPLSTVMAGLLGYFVGADRDRAKALLEVVAWSGAVLAVFAIASYVISPGKLFWWDKVAYREALTTPFVNRNAAALYYGVCSIAAGLRFWRLLQRSLPPGRLTPLILLEILPRIVRYRELTMAVATLLCLAAVLLTSSRAGTVLTLAGQVLAFTLLFLRDLPRRVGPVAALLLGGLIALIILQTLGGSASDRFNEYGLVDAGRWDTYRSTLRMIADFPWLGVGLGGFAFAFPAYRSGSFWAVWDRAHNVLLEIAAEGGVPLAVAVVVAWTLILLVLIHGIRRRRRDTIFPVAGLTVAAMALTHGMMDFSLEMAGFAIPTMAIIGAGAAQSFVTRKQADDAVREVEPKAEGAVGSQPGGD